MFEKIEILIITLFLFALFYIVISLGAKRKKNSSGSIEIKKYMFNVKMLILFVAIVFLILWFFL